jgi:hypothetical protein
VDLLKIFKEKPEKKRSYLRVFDKRIKNKYSDNRTIKVY